MTLADDLADARKVPVAMPLRRVRDMRQRLVAYLNEAEEIVRVAHGGTINWENSEAQLEIVRNGWTTVAHMDTEIASRTRSAVE